MARWEPDATSRLQSSAFELFAQYGYEAVTIAEIAENAGLTKRTFFNHFKDKREILFAGARSFEESVVTELRGASLELTPLSAVIQALDMAGRELERYREFGKARRGMIASSSELRERDLIKIDSLAKAMQHELVGRGVGPIRATIAAQVGISIFNMAYDDWIDEDQTSLSGLIQRYLSEVGSVVGQALPK